MKTTREIRLVLVMVPDLETGRKLAQAALAARLIACANLLPGLESHYWWRGKVESSGEVLLLLKTTSSRLPALERLVIAEHPYDTPEFIVLPVAAGNARYLRWLTESVQPAAPRARAETDHQRR